MRRCGSKSRQTRCDLTAQLFIYQLWPTPPLVRFVFYHDMAGASGIIFFPSNDTFDISSTLRYLRYLLHPFPYAWLFFSSSLTQSARGLSSFSTSVYKMPSRQYWFEGSASVTVSLPQNPGRLVTLHALPHITECVGVGALGFRHADEFCDWLDSPAVAPFWDEFRDHFLFRTPGHLFDPRVEWEYIQALFLSISEFERMIYRSAGPSGRPVNRVNWTPRQHYLRFMCSIMHYRGMVTDTNPDIWPNFDDNGQRQEGMTQGYQAWLTLGFLIVREQLNHTSGDSSPESSQGDPRTPDQSRRRLREPTATPEFPFRTLHLPYDAPSPAFNPNDGDMYSEYTEVGSPPGAAGHERGSSAGTSTSDQAQEFRAQMDEMFARLDDERDSVDEMLSLRYSGLPTTSGSSSQAALHPDGPVDFSTWQSVLSSTSPPSPGNRLPALRPAPIPARPSSGLVLLPEVITPGVIPIHPVRVRRADGSWVDRYYDRAGLLELTVEYAADGTMITRLDRNGPMAQAAAAARATPEAAAVRAQMEEMFGENPRPLGGQGGGGEGSSGPAGQ
jgi:hypothetical protein